MKQYVLKELAPLDEQLSSIDYENELNQPQFEAVSIVDGPVLVIAGAGSGKTRTLVYRVAHLVESGIPPENILLLTFTRKSAQEMLRRASLKIGTRCERVRGGTFHSVANTLLRRFAHCIGYEPTFTIMDRSDSEDAINVLRSEMGLNEKARRFPRKSTIAKMFSKVNNLLTPLAQVVERDFPHFYEELDDLLALQDLYAQYKQTNYLMDYDDLLLNLRNLLANNREVRAEVSTQFRYIMVDEYQDTNLPQADIVRLMAYDHDNVMVVGDDSQSIYSFRGANFRNIIEFPKLFPEARIITLEENYRSTQTILDVTNVIINNAREKFSKHLFTRKTEGVRPTILEAENENYQSRFICQKILELREEGIPLADMAVLFRAAFHSFDLEIELGRHNIPFVKHGGFKFVETSHVKDVLAHLRIVANPRDGISWNRILLLVDRIGSRTSQRIIEWLVKNGKGPENLGDYPQKGKYTAGLLKLQDLFVELNRKGLTVPDQIAMICRYYEPMLSSKFDDYPKRLKDLEHLQTITDRYHDLSHFLSDVALEPPNETVSDASPSRRDDEHLVLSTIHSAKGLEWHTIFIIWALEGKFPSSYAYDREEDMEEERRLMYVAATRAKENLFIAYPTNVYDRVLGEMLSKPSRFLREIPRDLYEGWALGDNTGDWIDY